MNLGKHGHLTYSTLVHQTDDWDQLWKSVNTYLPAVKARVAPTQKFGVCLRTSAPSAAALNADPGKRAALKQFFADQDLYLYTATIDSFKYAATRPLQWPPNTVGRYRNTDPVLINYLIRLALDRRKAPYHAFPQRELFDKIGIRNMVLETDPYGNFLTQGYELGAARDWARVANLYLQDGVWNGQRLLPEGFVEFVSTLAPAWEADKRPIYGGFFWLNGEASFPVPKNAYYMSGVGGQTTLIVPSHDLVVVRLGHYKGAGPGGRALRKALAVLMETVPPTRK